MRLGIGLALALLSTAALSSGFYTQHSASGRLPALSLRRPAASLRALFTSRAWLIGFVVGLAGWGLYIVALDLAPLSLVQATSAGGVGLLALLVMVGGVRLSRWERGAVAASVGGLVLLAVSLPAGAPHAVPRGWAAPMTWVLASIALAALAAGPAARLLRPGAGLAVAAGLLYSAGDVATKAAVSGTSLVVVFALLLPACHGFAFVAIQLAFQRGTAMATAGVSTLLTNLLPILAGIAVFAEHLPGGPAGVLRGIGFAAAVAGGALLSRPGRTERPPAPARPETADAVGTAGPACGQARD